MLSFDKAGEHAIFSLGKKGSWHAEAKFVVKMIGDAFVASGTRLALSSFLSHGPDVVVIAVVLELQASSDPQPEILVIDLPTLTM